MRRVSQEIYQLALEIAVDSSWSLIESSSNQNIESGTAWLAVSDKYACHAIDDAFALLIGLKLAVVHPKHKMWIREIAEL